MSDVTERLEAPAGKKPSLPTFSFKERATARGGMPISRRTVSTPCPLSFAQERLWFLDQFDPHSAVYNIPKAIRLRGSLNESALQQALDAVVARHEALRTTFRSVEGTPVQIVTPHARVQLRMVDLSQDRKGPPEARMQRVLQEEAQRRFDLTRDPLLRASLLRVGREEHILMLVIHHIASDGWSMGVLFRELARLYSAFSAGDDPSLPALPIQYADYAQWQRQRLRGEILATQLNYWKKQLDGLEMLGLPTDRPRPAVRSFRGAREQVTLPKELSESLRRLRRQERVSLFMVLLAAFKALLHRYTGQTDIAVGTPIANRTRLEIEELIGFFANTLVLRADLSGDPSFRALLRRVSAIALDAYDHQDLPFEKLVEALQPERSLGQTPLFQVMFVFQNAPSRALTLRGLSVDRLDTNRATTKFDLTLALREDGDRIAGSLEYSTDLFEAATIRRMLGHYQTLLEAVVQDPSVTISQAPILTDSERQQLLVAWNDTGREYPQACVHELFEARVKRHADSVAVVFEEKQLTYRELNQHANQVAHLLRRLGIRREMPVGICAERSLELVAGLLGILKSGGAYVPIDPAYPRERVALLLADAGVEVLLTQTKLKNRLHSHKARVVCLDAFFESDEAAIGSDSENLTCEIGPDNLAYVMYTSGSTGVPKGVEVVHRGIVRLVYGTDFARLGEEEAFLQLAPPSFDASTFEIWGALLHGGRCVLFEKDIPAAGDLRRIIKQQGVTTLWLTASLFNALVDEAPEVLAPIRQLLIGGEALSVTHVRRALELLPDTRLINGYGPTEGTTFSCCYPIPRQIGESTASIPIGRPIANTQVYILDRHFQPVPIGVPGELYIGGDGLARGYLKRPELTAERFIPNPFTRQPKARLYKTGDLARYIENGNIEFLGRIDDQVKIRGFRVELGEIETVLGSHPLVREVAVLHQSTSSDKRLVAYLVLNDRRKTSSNELRSFLEEKLPTYMIPSAFVFLEALPLTAAGKVRRKALGSLQLAPDREKGFVAPRNDLERQLAGIWEKLLGVRPIGVTDDFFELGGHSLLALKLFARIEKQFGKKLPLPTLFQASTVEQVASLLRDDSKAPSWSSLVPIQPKGSKQPLFGVHAGGAHVLFYRDLARRLGPDQPFYALQPQRFESEEPVEPSIEEMAAHYVSEIRQLLPSGPYHLGGSSFGGLIAFEMAQQLHAQGQKVGLVVLFDTFGPGYPMYLPGTTRFRRRMYRLLRRVQHHWGSLVLLEPREKLRYCLAKTVQAAVQFAAAIEKHSKGLARRFYFAISRPLPRSLRKTKEGFLRAKRQYVPTVYAGRLTLFRASNQPMGIYPDANLGWSGLAAGGVEVYEVPGSHGSIIVEPRVRFLVSQLRLCLERAQEDAPDRPRSAAPVGACIPNQSLHKTGQRPA